MGVSHRASRAESILCALRLSEDDRDLQALRFHAKTAARNNVRIVDNRDEFLHYTETVRALQ
jgi:hypothetical protein